MKIKDSDGRQTDLDTLAELANRSDIPAATKREIESERRKILAGIKGEKDATYHLDFHRGESKNSILIHDLRIEHGGRVAQIDHLLINRFLDIWLFETKHFGSGLAINDHGECTAFYKGRATGIPSPFAQNDRHADVLSALFADGAVALPRRLGFDIKPAFLPRVLVSSNARVNRPKVKRPELDQIVKVDQVLALLERDVEGLGKISNSYTIAKIVSRETLYDFGKRLVDAHRPATFDWHARFGIEAPAAATPAMSPPVTGDVQAPQAHAASCAACAVPVSEKVRDYCAEKAKRFKGHVFCYGCQRNKERRASVLMAAE